MNLMPVAEAKERLLSWISPMPAEDVALAEAYGRVLAEPLAARRTHPPFAASAMDGYAVRAADVADPPAELTSIGEIAAGQMPASGIKSGQCMRIFTGAPLPEGADAVLIQENTEKLPDNRIRALFPVEAGRHIRVAGLDFRQGEILLGAGRLLDAPALALAAAANHPILPVVRQPRIAILATGSELVPPGSALLPGQIVASNSYGIAALVRICGGIAADYGIVADDGAFILSRLREALAEGADVLVTIGGASVGDHDLAGPVLRELGAEILFGKVAMRPGKPVIAGRLGSTPVLALPGNPASAMVGAAVFLMPLVARLAGRPDPGRPRHARLAAPLPENGDREDYMRAGIRDTAEGLFAEPFRQQDSSLLRVLSESHGMIVRPPHAPAAAAGEICQVLLLRQPEVLHAQ